MLELAIALASFAAGCALTSAWKAFNTPSRQMARLVKAEYLIAKRIVALKAQPEQTPEQVGQDASVSHQLTLAQQLLNTVNKE